MTARQPRRHNIREAGGSGKFAKAGSPHHGAIKSTYDAAEVRKTGAFTPDKDAGVTPAPVTARPPQKVPAMTPNQPIKVTPTT